MKYAILIILLSSCFITNSQDSLRRRGPFKLSGISIQGGIPGDNATEASKKTIATIYPGFNSTSLASYTLRSGNYVPENNVMLTSHLIFNNYARKKRVYSQRRQTLVGISFSHEQKLIYGVYNYFVHRNDTLYSSAGGQPLYRDDVLVRNASIGYMVSSLGLDVQQLFSTRQERILSFYAGIGSSVQFSVKNEIAVQTREISGFYITSDPDYNYQANTANGNVQSHFLESTTISGSGRTEVATRAVLYKFYVPIGINVRLSTRSERSLSNLSLLLQLRVGSECLKVNGIDGSFHGYSAVSGGIKCKF